MARHSSFKVLIAQETYNNFFATIRARAQAPQWAEFGLDGDRLRGEGPGDPQLAGQFTEGSGRPDSAFISMDGLPAGKSEDWIESWLAGKTNGPTA